VYEKALPTFLNVPVAEEVKVVAVSLAGIFAVGMFLVNAVIAAYNITGTTEGPADPKFKRFPRDIIASALASAITGIVALLVVAV
jgi:tetrahydromethanopterin S-methyltransferase subunit D